MDYMERALALAQQALGSVSPNPAVGAVLVRDGQIVGEGFTHPPGGPHAEAVALEQAAAQAEGTTLYVTMEPCCHHGLTPPCTDALVQSGVREVHLPVLDPNPLINGKGKRQLEEAGVQVIVGEHQKEARRLNEAYLKYITTGLPFLTAKFASSLDGKIATVEGNSQWITGEAARCRAHQLRNTVDAVMVGIGTVLADNPLLTPRTDDPPREHPPLRIVVDSTGRTPPTARLFQDSGPVLIVTARESEERRHELERVSAEVIPLPAKDGRVDLAALLQHLGQREVISILAEGGSTLLGSLFDQRLVDKVAAFIAPRILGGISAPTAVAGHGFANLAETPHLHDASIEQAGQDIIVMGYPAY